MFNELWESVPAEPSVCRWDGRPPAPWLPNVGLEGGQVAAPGAGSGLLGWGRARRRRRAPGV